MDRQAEDVLDEALALTFPASDPVSIDGAYAARRAHGAARERIERLESELRAWNFFYAADCFKLFLEGKAGSLDEAFGLALPVIRGRPPVRRQEHLALARELLAFRLSPASRSRGAISRFEDELAKRYHLSDARKVREIYNQHETAVTVMREELLRRLDKDKSGR